ncbi:major facilitator superfamily transporter [Coniochaeta ligniaria NRRL 30616]|uniref:Major facilitator superfamily transporter n=1 Tax=Coniochaeta ligniaria NRRL 30616 TaxID=1408157 RepID=A0A1J7J9T0_9PEZI|nr:major facilitator superfamily transporter [Coniochaeta ligniaria NRRL 30616]
MNDGITQTPNGAAVKHEKVTPLEDGQSSDETSPQETREVRTDQELNDIWSARIFAIWLSIVCGVLCTYLDEGIIATAIPQITDQFRSLDDVGWYGSAYLMTLCAFQLVFGRLCKHFNAKVVFLTSLAIFEIGSLLCAVSPTSAVFIVGRAIAGCGGAGLTSGTIALLAASLPARGLPLYIGAVGIIYGVASVIGPVLGVRLDETDRDMHRCFYINLPLAAPPAITTLFFVKFLNKPQTGEAARPWLQKTRELDYLGIVLLLPSVTSLILALQLGSSRYGWSDGRTIGCFVVAGVLMLVFLAEQCWMDEKALIPPRIIKMRIVAFGSLFAFCLESAFLTLTYYLPLWFQAVQGVSAEESGVHYLALCVAFIAAIFFSGWAVTKLGYFQPFMLTGTVLVSVGSGLLSTLTIYSGSNQYIPYQIIAGLGIGASTDQPSVAVQRLLGEADAPLGVAVVLFCQNLGPTISVSVANSIFAQILTTGVRERLPDAEPQVIMDSGATVLRGMVPPSDVEVLLEIYNGALTRTFLFAAAMAVASVFGLIGIGTQKIATKDDGCVVVTRDTGA